MTRYTDARIDLLLEGVDLLEAEDIHVTFKQADILVDLTDVEVLDNHIIVSLTQEQTKLFTASRYGTKPEVQVNMLIGGKRVATEIARVDVANNLLEVVWE